MQNLRKNIYRWLKSKLKTEQRMFFFYGALFGSAFPIVGMLWQSLFVYNSISPKYWLMCQMEAPTLWIIDLAPLVLAIVASYAGRALDLLNQKNAEINERYQQMAHLREMADAANKSKGEFLANMSHEIRTPMNAIIGMSYLLKKTELNEKQKDYNHKIEVSARNLLRIIDDILDFSKIEAGKLTLEHSNLFLDELISEVSDAVNVKLQNKNEVELVTYVDPLIPPVILGDSVRLRQVLLNLTDNAAKFTKAGEVKLSAKLVKKLSYGLIIHFSVEDTGIGISKEQIEKLFSPFQQADVSTTRKFGGTGLGLVICKRIVEMMDGELEVESKEGKGSTFSFNAFFSLADANEQSEEVAVSMKGRKALLVDDSESARIVLNEMLLSLGFDVVIANDAFEAIELFEQEQKSDKHLSLMVVDWQMPGMDGLQLVREIKAKEGLDVPSILMVTAYGLESVREAAKNKLIDGVLLKPINTSTLNDTLNSILHLNDKKSGTKLNAGNETDLGVFKSYLEGVRVLLVEDNDINLQLAEELLSDVGVHYTAARNGLEAVEKVNTESFDAVLMDIQMPEMDGLTATKKIREDKRKNNLPIIAMTAHALKGEKEKSIAAGMNDHITKPIDPTVLYKALIKYVKGVDVNQNATAVTKEHKFILEIEGLDVKEGLNRIGGKVDSYKKLLETFVRNYESTAQVLIQFTTENNLKELAPLLHTISGVCGNIGAKEIYVVAYPLSHALKVMIEENAAALTIPQQKQLEYIADKLQKLISDIKQKLIATNESQVEKSSISEEMWLQKSEALKKLIEGQDGTSIDYCQQMLDGFELSDERKATLEKIKTLLDEFEFDAALALL
ncbi:MAG: response regulator [Bacteroidota bacterium]